MKSGHHAPHPSSSSKPLDKNPPAAQPSGMDRLPPKKFLAEPFAWQEEVELRVESLSNLGAGIARPNGWVVFIPFALPGELVKGKIWRNEKNCSHADLVEVLEESPHRVKPRCPLFGTCGGCQYQHLDYAQQLLWKTRQVGELLSHQAGLDLAVEVAVPSPREFGYRSKLTPHFQKPKSGETPLIGFLEHNRRSKMVDVPFCPIAMDEINAALPEARREVFQNASSYKNGATLLLRAHHGGKLETNPRTPISEKVGDLTFNFLAGDFFQNNPFILPAFVLHVAQEATAGGQRFLLDAYCGSGLFALSLANGFEKVTGIELSESSADWARRNAEANEIENATFLAASAEQLFADVTDDPALTSVVIDPPRKGCSESFLQQLFNFGPSRVVYVSCNPSTQARDLKAFAEVGYQVTKVQPFDLFPQTRHLECVVTLEKTSSDLSHK